MKLDRLFRSAFVLLLVASLFDPPGHHAGATPAQFSMPENSSHSGCYVDCADARLELHLLHDKS